MVAAQKCLHCDGPFLDVHQDGAGSSASSSRQQVYAGGNPAVDASSTEAARQAPAYYFTEELLDKYPPPVHLGIDEEDFAELRAELLGQKMGGRLPSNEQMKNYECVEEYMMYNAYVSW